MTVKCFLVKPAERSRRSLRRYCNGDGCPGPGSYHNAHAPIDVVEDKLDADGYFTAPTDGWDPADPRWPVKCEHCDYVFTDADPRQVFHEHIYVDDAGGEHTLRDRTPGMMWDADWMGESHKGPDGRALVVRCPDGDEWCVDGPASNCDKPNDRGPFDQAHRCWVRHGEPPNITVDKNGRTCGAGGGSIQTSSWHGFLVNGQFVLQR